jgi:hydroxyacylglutathione hydrolase
MIHALRRLLLVLLLVVGAGSGQATDEVRVVQIPLSMSNAFLVKSGTRSFLVDVGSKDDLPELSAALAREGVRFQDLAAVVLTHGHADHAGLAAEVRRRSGAVLIAGKGDRSMMESGVNEPVTATSLTARLILLLPIDASYKPFRGRR